MTMTLVIISVFLLGIGVTMLSLAVHSMLDRIARLEKALPPGSKTRWAA